VWLAHAKDLAILKAASWWDMRRLKLTLSVVGGVALMALIWIGVLRRQINRQLGIIQGKAQREAITEERQRIAREFHDTLEQELAGLTLRLDAAASRVSEDKARTILDQLRRLLTRLQSETRDFVWDLRDPSRTNASLTVALRSLLDHLQASSSATLKLEEPEGAVPTLPPLMQHHLMSIVREAVQNAVKHAKATEVCVSIQKDKDTIKVSVRDNGSGFQVEEADGINEGHFGIQGMKERARKIGGKLEILSQPGEGTRIECTAVP
jgi:signal transduction histidine kinase